MVLEDFVSRVDGRPWREKFFLASTFFLCILILNGAAFEHLRGETGEVQKVPD